jgi:hypothetical protein
MRRLPLFVVAVFIALCTSSVFAQVMNFTTCATGLNYPIHLAKDAAGNIYISDTGSYTIRKCTPANVCSVFAGTAGSQGTSDGPIGTGRFYRPTQIVTNADGSLLIGDVNGIRRVAADGTITTWIGWDTYNIIWVEALARDSAGNIYASESGYRNVIVKVTPDGVMSTFAGSATRGYADGAGTAASFYNITEMVFDANDNIYLTDDGNACIRKVTPAGVATTIAGAAGDSRSVDGPAGVNRLHIPMSLARSGSDIYFTDEHTVRKLDAAGNVTTIAGRSGVSGNRAATGTSARFYYAVSILVSGSTLYVGDDNMKLWKATPGISDAAAIDQPTGLTNAVRQLSVAASTGATYQWSAATRPNGSAATISGSGANATFTPDIAGDYSIRLDASSAAGTSVTYVDFTAHCDAQAPVIAVSPTSICAFQNGTATVGNPASYVSFAWTIANGAIDSGVNAGTVSFHSTSTAAVQLTVAVVDTLGCTSTASYTVPMTGTPPAIQLWDASICPSATSSASIDASYLSPNWSAVHAFLNNAYSSSMTFQGDGSGQPVQLSVTATDPTTGCTVASSATVPIRTLTKPAIQLDQTLMCPNGQNGASIDTALYPPPPPSQFSQYGGYEWHITNGTFIGGQFSSHATFVHDGSANPVQLYVIYRTNDYCQTTSDVTTVPLSTPTPPTISLDTPDVCPYGNDSASITGSYASIWWDITNATITGGSQGTNRITFSPSAGSPGTPTQPVQLTVRVTDSASCTATTNTVTVPLRTIAAPAVTLATPDVCPNGSDSASVAGTWASIWWDVAGGQINGGQGTNSITFSPSSGMYGPPTGPVLVTVHVIDSSNCQATSSTVSVPMRTIAAPAVTLATPNVCPNGSDSASVAGTWASIWWDVAGGQINSGQGTNSITFSPSSSISGPATDPVLVTVHVIDSSNCQATSSTVSVPMRTIAAPAVTLAAPNVCPNGSDSASVTGTWASIWWDVAGGQINGGQGTNSITFSPSSGMYGPPTDPVLVTVHVTDSSNCQATSSTVSVPLRTIAAPAVTLATADVCPYGSDSASVPGTWTNIWWEVSGGQINSGQGTTSITFSPSSGTYGPPTGPVQVTVHVTDASNCQATSSTVSVPLRTIAAPAVTLATADVCPYGSDSASIAGTWTNIWWEVSGGQINSAQGTNSITFAPSSGISGPSTDPVLVTVHVTDSSNCQATSSTVSVPIRTIAAPTISLDVPVICPNGAPDSASITGAWTRMVYWSIVNGTITSGDGTNRIVFTANGAGPVQLTVRVTDADGCTATTNSVTVPLDVPQAAITASGPTSFCAGGSVTLTAAAASSYLWSTGATTQSIVVNASGTYTVTVTGQGGCTASASSTVTADALPPSAVTSSGPTTFCAGRSVTLTAAAGYTYLWSNNATTRSLTVSSTGAYSVTVTDANGCSSTSAPVNVTVNALPSIAGASAPPLVCWNGTGYTASVTNDPSLTYAWTTTSSNAVLRSGQNTNALLFDVAIFSPSQTTIDLRLTATNASGCSTVQTFSIPISNPDATITASGATTFCKGGSVTLTAAPGLAYLWSNNATTQSITVSDSGMYRVTVSDANGCAKDSMWTPVTVNDPPKPTISAYGSTAVCDGSSLLLVSSGPGPWLWSTGATTQSITVTDAGSYTVTTTDPAAACSVTSNPTVITKVPLPPAPVITVGTSCAMSPVVASVQHVGGVTVTWHLAAGSITSTSGDTVTFYPATNDTLTATFTNAGGCTSTATAPVTVHPTPDSTITASGPVTFCQGGSVTLTAPAGMTSYNWSNGANTRSITVSASGAYHVTVVDSWGCSATSGDTNVTVNPLPDATITASGPTTFCAGGTVTLTAPAGMTSYAWSNGATTQSITVGTVGSYHVVVTNSNSCTAQSADVNVTVNASPAPVITAPSSICAGSTATASVPAVSGATYAWTVTNGSIVSGAGSNTIQFTSNASSATLAVTVTSASGCSGNATANVTVNPLPLVVFSTVPDAVCMNVEAAQEVQPQANVTYNWTITNGTITQNAGHRVYYIATANPVTLRVTQTDLNGCSASDQRTIQVHTPVTPTVTAGGATTFCTGGSVTLTASVGTSYLWSTGETTRSITVTSTGAWHVTVQTLDGCSASSADTNVTVNTRPNATIVAPSSFCSGTTATASVAAVTGGSYAWTITGGTITSGASTSAITFTSTSGPVTLNVTVTNANNCPSSSSATVGVNALPNATITAPASFCSGTSATASVAAISGGTYSWTIAGGSITSAANTSTITFTSTSGPVTLNVTVTNANNCTSSSSATVGVNALPNATITTPASFCSGTSATASVATVTGGSYAWTITGGTITSGANTNAITFTSTAGPVTLGATVTNANGCRATSSSTVAVTASTAIQQPANASIARNATTTLTVTATGANLTYKWYSGQYPSGTVIGTTATVTVGPFTKKGTNYYYVEVTGTCGIVRSAPVTVTVN